MEWLENEIIIDVHKQVRQWIDGTLLFMRAHRHQV